MGSFTIISFFITYLSRQCTYCSHSCYWWISEQKCSLQYFIRWNHEGNTLFYYSSKL